MNAHNDGLTRRKFLKGGAAAIGVPGFGVFTHAPADSVGPEDTINAALIWAGACVISYQRLSPARI